MTRNCAKCGTSLPVETGRGRKRKMCAACSPSRPRKKAAPVRSVVAATAAINVVGAVRSELDAAGTAGTAAGQTALQIAAAIDSGEERGAALAALAKQLNATMVVAVGKSEPDADPIQQLRDELAARRDGRSA